MTAAYTTVTSGPDEFVLRAGRVRWLAWRSRNGRWYWHRLAGGRVTDSGSYASRRSCRRAILARIAAERDRQR
jgi:hypothetical protein